MQMIVRIAALALFAAAAVAAPGTGSSHSWTRPLVQAETEPRRMPSKQPRLLDIGERSYHLNERPQTLRYVPISYL